jgi:hypothetical protein
MRLAAGRPRPMRGSCDKNLWQGDTVKEAEKGQAADEPQGAWGRHRAKLGAPLEGAAGFPSEQ